MKNHYAIFLDIDGTLMDGDNIPEENVKSIIRAREMGHKVFINTGRSFGYIPQKVLELPINGFVAGLGKHIVYEGKTLRSSVVPKNVLKEVTDYCKAKGKRLIFEGETECLYFNCPPEMGKRVESPEDFDTVYKNVRITKVTFYEKMVSEEDMNFLKNFFHAVKYDEYVETVCKGYSKARGIKIVENLLRIKHEDTVAVGDSLNDLEMMEYAHTSIAMGNAVGEIKKLADFITTNVEEAGVAHAIERYILTR